MGGGGRVADPRKRWRSPLRRIWSRLSARHGRLTPSGRRWVGALAVLVPVVAVAVTVGALAGRDRAVHAHPERITVHDGPGGGQRVSLDATLFVPDGVDARHRAAAVIVAHGFGGSKDSVRADAVDLARRGYLVLTYSARGFGRSTGRIALDSPDYEVADARQLVDWLARRPEVRLDSPGDPRVGVTGGSYGGALALLLAGYDRRIDAIVPVATWNDLSHAFFPDSVGATGATPAGLDQRSDDGVFKKLWAANLFASGVTRPAVAGDQPNQPSQPAGSESAALCGGFRPEFCAAYQAAARTGRATPGMIALLRRSSPATVLDRIGAPTLLIQGETDSLFPLAEADANARGIAANGTPVRVVWFAGGHDAGPGLADTDRLRALTGAWFDHYLRGRGPAPATTFQYARTDPPGGVDTGGPGFRDLVAPAYPGLREAGTPTARQEVTLRGRPQTMLNPAGGVPAAVSGLPGLAGDSLGGTGLAGALGGDLPGQSVRFDGPVFDRTVDVVGAPTISVRVSSSTESAVLFAKLYDVDSQGRATLPQRLVAPVRVTGLTPGRPRTVRVVLPAVVHRFTAGHRMRLVLASTDQAYASPADPAAYRVSLVDGRLSVPRVPGVRTGLDGSSVPWLVAGALVVAAVAGAAGVTGARRARGRRGGVDTALAGVPLVVDHLTKTYGGPEAPVTAVRDLSLRVERGQVLGLLGPNGAGKTTALRILMGLIHPSSGQVRVFGHVISPGAPVLSRVGSFVEGPGFLPHLSGRDNLALYWRATGRPESDSHAEEALAIAGLGDAVHRRVRTYSQGMRQRLALAQAMLGRPDLLVLDEPTNGLDPPQIHQMRRVLRDYAAAGRTVLVSSHLLAEVEQTCTHVVVMHRGALVAAGTVADIVGAADTVRVGVDDPAAALRVVRRIEGVTEVTEAEGTLLVTLGALGRSELVAGLVAAGVGVHQVVPRRRLEDAFLSLVEDER
ncbi:MAG TPA: alpha/beta fold hydrolase [Mycobacteriales bacterium]|nr:alpha/beta fold hydrolase [Mycobacteriales bacterium]